MSCISLVHTRLWAYPPFHGLNTVPQTREVACTKEVLPQVISRGCFTNVFFLTVTLYVSRFADYRACP